MNSKSHKHITCSEQQTILLRHHQSYHRSHHQRHLQSHHHVNQQDHRLQRLTGVVPGGKGVDRVGVKEGEVEEAGGEGVGVEVGVEEPLGVPH